MFTAANFTLSRRTLKLTEQGQVTDRYTKAIEQLGSNKLDVRVGGVYALERIARDSARNHPALNEDLAAFIREHSAEQWPPVRSANAAEPPEVPKRKTRPDMQVAVAVIGRRDVTLGRGAIDLHAANLDAADVEGANLAGAILHLAILTEAHRRMDPGQPVSFGLRATNGACFRRPST